MWRSVRVHYAVPEMRSGPARHLHRVSAAIATGKRPAPFRTRKLSPSAPMVLPGGPGGRVGRRRASFVDGGHHNATPAGAGAVVTAITVLPPHHHRAGFLPSPTRAPRGRSARPRSAHHP